MLLDNEILDSIEKKTDPTSFFKTIESKKLDLLEKLKKGSAGINRSTLLYLKTINILVSKYQYMCKHTALVSRPAQLIIEPSNNCILSCPKCVHSSNKEYLKNKNVVWQGGNLKSSHYKSITDLLLPFATSSLFYNFGEPFLNKNFTSFIKETRRHLVASITSSNLNVPNIDADDLVRSGLNLLIVSLDGTAQETYEKFRKGGNIDFVYQNLKNIVEAKKRLNSLTPSIQWQYLTFKHNLHEVEPALEIAKELGLDSIKIATPRDPSDDDPACQAATSEKEGVHRLSDNTNFMKHMRSIPDSDLIPSDQLTPHIQEDLFERMQKVEPLKRETHKSQPCEWLYKSMSIDGNGNLIPCCVPPLARNNTPLFFGKADDSNGYDQWNNAAYVLARSASKTLKKGRDKGLEPHEDAANLCLQCNVDIPVIGDIEKPSSAAYLRNMDQANLLSDDDIKFLTTWS